MTIKTIKILDDLFQFNTYVESIDMSFNQFLIMGTAPLLIHTGTHEHMRVLLPELQSILGEKELSYIFISHFESDECGGLGLLIERYPKIEPLCSETSARQLSGFGITDNALVESAGNTLFALDERFEFIAYPSEMHLWDGLMLFERKRSVLFSSDLFGRFGKLGDEKVTADWDKLVAGISQENIPFQSGLKSLRNSLSTLPVSIVAPGHGPCVMLSARST